MRAMLTIAAVCVGCLAAGVAVALSLAACGVVSHMGWSA